MCSYIGYFEWQFNSVPRKISAISRKLVKEAIDYNYVRIRPSF
jgi:hypothetical protein